MTPPHAIDRATIDDAAAIAAVQVRAWRDTYRGIVPDAYLDSLDAAVKAAEWRRILDTDSTVFVARHDTFVVGYVSVGPQREPDLPCTGEIHALYVLATAKGTGLGRALMRQAATHLADAGHRGLALWVMSRNTAAVGFYRHLGGVAMREHSFEIDATPIAETAYVWTNSATLIG